MFLRKLSIRIATPVGKQHGTPVVYLVVGVMKEGIVKSLEIIYTAAIDAT